MTEQKTNLQKENHVKFPRTTLYLRFSVVCAILISIVYMIIQSVGSPPLETGIVSIVSSITLVVLAGILMFVEILILGAALALNLWRSAAITWVASNADEIISSSDVTMLRKATVIPYKKVQIGIPLLTFALVVVLLSIPIGNVISASFSLDLVDALLIMTSVCIGVNMLIEYSHIRLERKYTTLPDLDLQSALALVSPAEPIDGISEILNSEIPDEIPRWFLILNILLFSVWCIVALLLVIM